MIDVFDGLQIGIRAKALSLTSGFGWILTFAVFEFSSAMIGRIHGKMYVIYTCFCIIIIAVVYFFFPETKVRCSDN